MNDDFGRHTIAQVAEMAGIHAVSLSRLRMGDRLPSMTMVTKIAALGWKFADQAKYLERSKAGNRFAYAQELQDFMMANYHVPKTTIKALAEQQK